MSFNLWPHLIYASFELNMSVLRLNYGFIYNRDAQLEERTRSSRRFIRLKGHSFLLGDNFFFKPASFAQHIRSELFSSSTLFFFSSVQPR